MSLRSFGLQEHRSVERALEVDRLESAGPVLDSGAIGLRRLLAGTKAAPRPVHRLELDPADPGAVGPRRAVDRRPVRRAVASANRAGALVNENGHEWCRAATLQPLTTVSAVSPSGSALRRRP